MLPDSRVRQRDYLLEISRALTQELDLEKLLGRILDLAIEILAGQAGLITLHSETGGWHVVANQGLPPIFSRLVEPYLNDIAHIPVDDNTADFPDINRLLTQMINFGGLGLLTGVALPLIARDQVVGLIFIFRGYPGIFSPDDRDILSSFANQAAIAVQNAQLYTQLSSQKARLDALLDSTGDGILILTPDFRIDRCNPSLMRILGRDQTGIQNLPHDQVIRWVHPPQGLTLEQAAAGGWPLTAHAHLYVEGDLFRDVNSPPLPVGITYSPLLSADGQLLNVIAMLRDITRFRQAEELKSTFISIISHELKTPVALIKGYVSTLRREDADWDPAIVQDSLMVIEEEADHLTGLIENLLDASRLQAGGLPIKRSDLNLPLLAGQLVERFQNQSMSHTLVSDFPADFPILLADETRIGQVLSNLISNAMKYSPQGGEIRISGQVRPDSVIVCVSDQGSGIAAEDIPHIFDRFYRAPEMARQTKGAGLGLYLARAIVEAHGGRIWVDTESGKGARICFSLPMN
jgi:signal transduction histidine kinase